MPLYWVIDSRERLMTAVAEGPVRREEVDAYLDAMAGARAGNYRKLFDGSRGEPQISADDIMAVAVRMRGMQQLGQAGPLAIVMPRDRYDQFARMLGILAVPDRPMQFFSDAAAARAWLDQPDSATGRARANTDRGRTLARAGTRKIRSRGPVDPGCHPAPPKETTTCPASVRSPTTTATRPSSRCSTSSVSCSATC